MFLQIEGKSAQNSEVKNSPDNEERLVKKSAFPVQQRIVSRAEIPPLKQNPRADEYRDEEKCEIRNQARKVFELAPHNNRPIGIGSVVKACPKNASEANCEEIAKPKKP
jgi:hypothetical protein